MRKSVFFVVRHHMDRVAIAPLKSTSMEVAQISVFTVGPHQPVRAAAARMGGMKNRPPCKPKLGR